MAKTIIPNTCAKFVSIAATSGQIVLIEILNADGTVSATLFNGAVPTGFSLEGSLNYSGNVS